MVATPSSTEVKALRGANADMVIAKLNPIITGWAAYYRIGVSKRAIGALDAHMWRLVCKWASFPHSNKSKGWVIAQYFGMFNPARQDEWIFGSRETGSSLRRFAWTPIVRHRIVAGTASPHDPHLSEYWAQQGDPQARGHRLGGQARRTNAPRPVSYNPTAAAEPPTAPTGQHRCMLPASLQGLLEPVAWKAGTAGSEGPRRSNAPGLPDEIVFSIIQRKVIKPVDFADLDALAARLTAFEPRYNATATPFDRRFTRAELTALLARIQARQPAYPSPTTAPAA